MGLNENIEKKQIIINSQFYRVNLKGKLSKLCTREVVQNHGHLRKHRQCTKQMKNFSKRKRRGGKEEAKRKSYNDIVNLKNQGFFFCISANSGHLGEDEIVKVWTLNCNEQGNKSIILYMYENIPKLVCALNILRIIN